MYLHKVAQERKQTTEKLNFMIEEYLRSCLNVTIGSHLKQELTVKRIASSLNLLSS